MLVALALVGPIASQAVVHNGTIDGDVAQATSCAVASTSRIVGSVTYDDVSGLFTWSYSFGDNAPGYDDGDLFAGGTQTIAHFHGPAVPGVGAGVTVGTGNGNPVAGSATISPGEGADLLAELWYLNIHSSSCGGGELRGQVLFPAPSVPGLALPLLPFAAVGAIGAGWLAMREGRRRA